MHKYWAENKLEEIGIIQGKALKDLLKDVINITQAHYKIKQESWAS